jgi:hypothetical protein
VRKPYQSSNDPGDLAANDKRVAAKTASEKGTRYRHAATDVQYKA